MTMQTMTTDGIRAALEAQAGEEFASLRPGVQDAIVADLLTFTEEGFTRADLAVAVLLRRIRPATLGSWGTMLCAVGLRLDSDGVE